MSELVESAVTKMLGAFGVRVTADRVESYVEAVSDAELCERCAVRACRNLIRSANRTPFVVALVNETHDVMGSAEHNVHVTERKQIRGEDLGAWWSTEAPVLIRRAWPELTGEQAIALAQEMEKIGCVLPDWESIAADIGFVDERGPTTEREWWLQHMPHMIPAEETRYV